MELRVLEYFLMVAKEGNITKAADKLHITQPTLSRQLKELETELKTTLFLRGKRQILLTEAGTLLLQRANELVGLMAKTQRDLSESQTQLMGSISIGCVETSVSRFLVEQMISFTEHRPMVLFDIVSGNGDDLREKLDHGSIDLAILLEPIETAKYDAIKLPIEEIWGIVVNVDHPLAKLPHVTVQELKDLPLIISRRSIVSDEMESWLGVPKAQLNIVATHTLLTNTLLMVKRKFGYPFIVQGAFEMRPDPTMKFIPLFPQRTSGHVLAWKKNQIHNPATRLFRQYIQEKVSD